MLVLIGIILRILFILRNKYDYKLIYIIHNIFQNKFQKESKLNVHPTEM